MSDDIVARLRVWGGGFSGNNPDCENDCDEAADEIERLRLTDGERDAIRRAIDWLSALATTQENSGACAEDAATLRCLLLRTPKCATH